MNSPVVRVSVIGTCEVTLGRARVRPDAAVLFPLVLYLALRAGSRVTRDELLDLLWIGPTEPAHRHSLRQLLYRIRRAGLEFDVDGSEITIDPTRITVDLAALHASDWAATVALGDIPPQSAILQAYQVRPTPAFGQWVEALRAEAGSQILRAALRHVATGRREGRWPDVETAARLALGTDPLNEEATAALAEATAMGGSKAAALRILDVYLWEIGERGKAIGLPVRMLRRRISEQPQFRTQRTGEPPLIARADDLAWLNGRLDLAAGGVNCTAMLLGPPGIGKTAVARAFTAHAEMRGWRISQSRLQPSDVDRPMSVFVELLPGLLKSEGAAGAAPESIAQLRRLVEHRGVEDDILADKSQEAEAVQARIRASSLDLIGAIAHEGPLILLLEDLHWIDLPSIRLLAWLIEHAASVSVLWLLTARLESRFSVLREALPPDRVPSRMVEPLGAGDAATLFTAFAPQVEAGARVTELAYAVTGGNPLFIREVAGHWIETGGDERLPSNLRALMRGRVARLTPASQRVLHCCAILGRFATVPRVTTVLQVSTVELLDAIEELDGLGLLGLAGEPGSLALHDLWQEELVATMRAASRALLHLRSGEVLEAESAESRSASTVSEAARHLIAAGARDRALRMLEDAATYQLANGLNEDAVASIELAVEATASDAERHRLETWRLTILQTLGRWHDIALSIERVSILACSIGETSNGHSELELIELEATLVADLCLENAIDNAMQCATASSASHLHRASAARLGARAASNLVAADQLTTFANIACQLDRSHSSTLANILAVETIFHTDLGSLDQAIESSTSLVTIERSSKSLRGLVRALRTATVPLRTVSRFELAHALAVESFDIARREQLAADAAASADMVATILFEMGALGDAIAWLDKAEPWVRRVGASYARTSADITRAMISLETGNATDVLRTCPSNLDQIAREPSVRHRLFHLSIALRAFLLRGDSLGAAEYLAPLEALLAHSRPFRRNDYFVASYAIGLAALRTEQQARQFVASYYDRARDPGVRRWRELSAFVLQ